MKFLPFFLLFLFASCGGNKNPEILNAHDSLMDLHDESMKRFSDLKKLKKKLKSMESRDAETANLFVEVQRAEDEMWAWMHQWEKPDSELSIEAQKEHYAVWMKKMVEVDENIILCLASAKNIQ